MPGEDFPSLFWWEGDVHRTEPSCWKHFQTITTNHTTPHPVFTLRRYIFLRSPPQLTHARYSPVPTKKVKQFTWTLHSICRHQCVNFYCLIHRPVSKHVSCKNSEQTLVIMSTDKQGFWIRIKLFETNSKLFYYLLVVLLLSKRYLTALNIWYTEQCLNS